jgi:hypothetical protein
VLVAMHLFTSLLPSLILVVDGQPSSMVSFHEWQVPLFQCPSLMQGRIVQLFPVPSDVTSTDPCSWSA